MAQARQVLLGQLGRRNGVASLYQQVIDQASNNYADLTLMDMVALMARAPAEWSATFRS
ncbi:MULTISPECIES: hypothetical protein [unclassified Pseudomonas]|uniref:hypothetical protein n=1 Tax=unclassified Pseudomonas TaxID=196821 RepID=UPI001304AAC2|nr:MULTISPECIES: hypothetical protein [unclassified Pseudomonas]